VAGSCESGNQLSDSQPQKKKRKGGGKFLFASQLEASQEGPISMELVS
jgi:hypothetical protein